MPLPPPPRIRAAAPLRPPTFDPWNSTSRGHQHANNALSGSIGWRETRETKLHAQLRGGLGGSGGKRIYDLVGRGAKDEGLRWLMAQEAIDGRGSNRKLNMKGEIEGGKGEEMLALDDLGTWDGRVKEERICLDTTTKQKGKVKRGRSDDEDLRAPKRARRSEDVLTGSRDRFSDGKIKENASTVALEACIISADDDDEIWGADELPTSNNQEPGHLASLANSAGSDTPRTSRGLSSNEPSIKPPSKTTSNFDNKPDAPRQNTPPSGQTRYPSPSPSPPSPPKTSNKKPRTNHSNVVQQTTASVILQRPKPIFAGLTVHVSGPTLPLISDHALRGLLVQHGATLVMHLARRRITHVVLGQPASTSSNDNGQFTGAGATFAAGKLQREMHRIRSTTGGPGLRFVSVKWVLESIKAGVRLSEARFGIGMEQAESMDTNQSGPLSKEERETIGSEIVTSGQRRRVDRRAARAREMGNGKASINAFQKGIARQTAAMPGAPPGVPSVRSLFLKQHRDNAWTKAGFVMKK